MMKCCTKIIKRTDREEGGRYKTEIQCLAVVYTEVISKAISSKSLGSQVGELWTYARTPPPCLFRYMIVVN